MFIIVVVVAAVIVLQYNLLSKRTSVADVHVTYLPIFRSSTFKCG